MASYVKFFGGDKYREELTFNIKDELKRAECHYSASFSEHRKPVKFKENDLIFLARLTKKPNDYAIFGRGLVASTFLLPRDRATASDIIRIEWKKQWPLYLRLKETQFIEGSLKNGILLEDVIKKFQLNSFTRTKTWFDNNKKNIKIRTVFCNQPDVELTKEASLWVNEKFEVALQNFGQISDEYIANLPKPEVEL